MKDDEYKKKLEQAAAAMRKALRLLEVCEDEYVRRYGHHPSDIDDDCWIDSMTGTLGSLTGLTPKQVDAGAVLSGCDSFYSNAKDSRAEGVG